MDQRTRLRIEKIAQSTSGKFLVEFFEEVQDQVADVRFGNYSAEARKAAIELIEKGLIEPFKNLSRVPAHESEGEWD